MFGCTDQTDCACGKPLLDSVWSKAGNQPGKCKLTMTINIRFVLMQNNLHGSSVNTNRTNKY